MVKLAEPVFGTRIPTCCAVCCYWRTQLLVDGRDPTCFPSFVHQPIDGPRDATLAVDEGQPTAIGPRTRSQTRRAANNLSAHDRHSSDACLHDPSRNDRSDHHESAPCPIISAPTARDVRSARRAARASARPAVRPSTHTSPTKANVL